MQVPKYGVQVSIIISEDLQITKVEEIHESVRLSFNLQCCFCMNGAVVLFLLLTQTISQICAHASLYNPFQKDKLFVCLLH